MKDPKMVDQVPAGRTITFNVKSFELGHWCPFDEDLCNFDSEPTGAPEIWVHQTQCEGAAVSIDLALRRVEIQPHGSRASFAKPESDCDALSALFADLASEMFDSAGLENDLIWFRFKELRGFMDLCRVETSPGSYSIGREGWLGRFESLLRREIRPMSRLSTDSWTFVVLRLLPVLTQSVEKVGLGGSNRFCDERYGQCHGFRLNLDTSALELVLHHEGLQRFQDFGVLRREVSSRHNASILRVLRSDGSADREAGVQLAMLHKLDAEIGQSVRTIHTFPLPLPLPICGSQIVDFGLSAPLAP